MVNAEQGIAYGPHFGQGDGFGDILSCTEIEAPLHYVWLVISTYHNYDYFVERRCSAPQVLVIMFDLFQHRDAVHFWHLYIGEYGPVPNVTAGLSLVLVVHFYRYQSVYCFVALFSAL